MSNIFFTSDSHFGHANIIKYCNRPFTNVDEMDEALITSFNKVVKPGDTVYHIGDFALVREPNDVYIKYARRLNGQKFLIYGNHDRWRKNNHFANYGFIKIVPYLEIKIGEQKITLLHYAMKVWNGSHRGSWQLHGHSHGSLPRNYAAYQLDVGVDVWNYTPISYDFIADEMKKINFKSVDKHDM